MSPLLRKPVQEDPAAAELERLHCDLRMARRAGDTLAADLAQEAINHILDNWGALHA
jgi:hypothetical protein